jgi:hypothetical protein
MAIGQGAYGRGGLIGGAARTSQKGASYKDANKYKAQDARNYLQGDDRLSYDNALAALNKGYQGNLSAFTTNLAGGGGYSNSKADRKSQAAYFDATAQMKELRKKAMEAARKGGGITQAEGASRSGIGRGATMPGKGQGGLFKPLEIDQTWMKGKKGIYSQDYDAESKTFSNRENLHKPWLWTDY